MAIFKYPLKAPVEGDFLDSADAPTGRIDYLKIQRFRINHEGSEGGYGGSNLPANTQKTVMDSDVVYLAMPQSISIAYQADYSAINMGTIGVLGAAAAAAVGGGSDAAQLTAQIQSAATAALPEIAYNKGAKLIAAANEFGLETGVTGAALQQLVKGRIMNPFTEQIFNGVQFRNHQFTIKMFARNKKEAEEILRIIKYLKKGAMPILGDAEQKEIDQLKASELGKSLDKASEDKSTAAGKATSAPPTINTTGKFLKIPDRFQLDFVRLDSATAKISRVDHYKFQPCVCTNVSVNYTPDGQYVSFKDGIASLGSGTDTTSNDKGATQLLVPAVELGLAFAETRFVTQADIDAGF